MSIRDLQPVKEKGLGRMVFVSALLHVFVISGIVAGVAWKGSRVSAPIAYTVELVDPAAAGGTLSSGPLKTSAPAPASPQKPEVKPSPPPKKEKKEVQAPKAVPPPKPAEKTLQPPPTPLAKEKEVKEEVSKKVELPKENAVKAKPVPQVPKAVPPPKPAEKVPPSTPSAEELDKQYLAAIDRIKRQMGGSASPAPRPDSGQGPPGVGGEGPGGGGVVRGFEFLIYYNQLQNRVKESWIVTERKQGLSAVVRFGVQPGGEIFDIELVKSSGDHAFDQSVLRAVNKANPLPPPPLAYQQEFAVQKVEVTFGEEERSN